MTDDELRAAIVKARSVAAKVGPMHGAWDSIFDAEAILAGQKPILPREQVEELISKYGPDKA